MAVPFLSTLSAAARLAYPAIVGGVRRGLSANSIGTILRNTGIGIRRSTLLDIVARSRLVFQYGGRLRALPKNRRPNIFSIPEALTKTTRQYAFTLEVKGTAADTGQATSQFITLATDSLMTREQMEALAMEVADEGKERYGMISESATFVDGIRAGELGVL